MYIHSFVTCTCVKFRSLTILIVCKFVILFSRSVLLFFPKHSIFVLSVIEVVSYPLQSFGDFLILYDSYRENCRVGGRDSRINVATDNQTLNGDGVVDEEGDDVDPEGYHVFGGLSGHSMHSQMSEDQLMHGLDLIEPIDDEDEIPTASNSATINHEIPYDSFTKNILHSHS